MSANWILETTHKFDNGIGLELLSRFRVVSFCVSVAVGRQSTRVDLQADVNSDRVVSHDLFFQLKTTRSINDWAHRLVWVGPLLGVVTFCERPPSAQQPCYNVKYSKNSLITNPNFWFPR